MPISASASSGATSPHGNLGPVTPVLLAHQGGWDEILLVLVPIALFALLLGVANRRANAIESRRRGDDPPARRSGRGTSAEGPGRR